MESLYALSPYTREKIPGVAFAGNLDIRIQFQQRHQNKGAIGHPRVRHFKSVTLYLCLPVQQQVQIQRAWGISKWPLTSEGLLDFLQRRQQMIGGQAGVDTRDCVDEIITARIHGGARKQR
jgi:hypothetical protein